MTKKLTVTEIRSDHQTTDRTARDEGHAQRMTDRIKQARPTSRVTTTGGK